jgi:hypothetical protein
MTEGTKFGLGKLQLINRRERKWQLQKCVNQCEKIKLKDVIRFFLPTQVGWFYYPSSFGTIDINVKERLNYLIGIQNYFSQF